MCVEQTDNVAVGDLLRAAVDRAVHLPRRRPLHHHLRGDPPQDARGQCRAAQDLHKLGSGYDGLTIARHRIVFPHTADLYLKISCRIDQKCRILD